MNKTEEFWKGEFGIEYAKRNTGLVARNAVFFAKALLPVMGIRQPQSVLELGCGTGQNLEALQLLLGTKTELEGVEINEQAARTCKVGTVHVVSIKDYIENNWRYTPWDEKADREKRWDLVLTKGVLIHQSPNHLPAIYDLMYRASNRYIFIAEYYNPTPVEVEYRGHQGVLWKRDFAGELMDQHPDVKLVDTGFAYHRAPQPQDDLTYFLFEKVTA